MTSVKLLHVSTLRYHPQKCPFCKKKGILAQHANLNMLQRPTRYNSHAPSGRDLFG